MPRTKKEKRNRRIPKKSLRIDQNTYINLWPIRLTNILTYQYKSSLIIASLNNKLYSNITIQTI